MKKIPGKYTDEELLQILQEASPKELEEKEQGSNILAFFSFYKIVPGKHRVKRSSLYDLYIKWTKEPLTKKAFYLELSNHFTITNHSTYCYINLKSFQIRNHFFEAVKSNKRDKTKSLRYKQHFDKFLNENNIKDGTYYIEAFVLYHLYDKWQFNRTRKSNPLSYGSFNAFLKLNFKMKIVGCNDYVWFAVDKSILDHFTEESLSRIRKGRYEKKSKKRKSST